MSYSLENTLKQQEQRASDEKENSFRSGFIAIIGLPNVGKSTLLNRILHQKISIVSPKPQTTRNRIVGVKHMPGAQLIFLDTPGVAVPKTKLNKAMQEEVLQAVVRTDIILLVVEADKEYHPKQIKPLELITGKTAILLVINKIDRIKKDKLLAIIDDYQKLACFSEIIPVSALKGDNIDRLVELLYSYLPVGPRYFPEEITTDRPETFMIAETIREKITLFTHQELPHTSAVIIDDLRWRNKNNELAAIEASIFVEKESQKAIVIGKGGQMIKKIGEAARRDLEPILGSKIYLKLRVAVKKGWTDSDKLLKEFGYI